MKKPRYDNSTEPCVYLIRGQGGFYKIGTTSDLRSRLRTLQQSSPVRLAVVGSGRGGRTLEASMHAQFAHRRHSGEWFALDDDDVKLVRRMLDGYRPARPERRKSAKASDVVITRADGSVTVQGPYNLPQLRTVFNGRRPKARRH